MKKLSLNSLLVVLAMTVYPLPFTVHAVPSSIGYIEEGKALYESGRYMEALGKFMLVLRSDPQNAEARQYVSQVVDQMKQNPGAGRKGAMAALPTSAQTEMRKMLRKRAAFSLGLKSIPGVTIASEGAINQVLIDANQIFPPNAGGLKEEGIPILDRVSAWLKTFGAQPVFIHVYPEELQDPATSGPLFIRRYSELYNFFTQERKIPTERFVSTDAIVDQSGEAKPVASAPSGSTGAPRIVIEAVGSQSSLLEGGMPSSAPRNAIARWLEFAVIAMRDIFNPEEGEWSTMDVVALSRTGLRTWEFKIVPEGAGPSVVPVLTMSGKTNVLKRLTWDGRDAKTGSFVPGGTYIARLTATDSDGTIKTEQAVLRVQRSTADEPVIAPKTEDVKPVKKAKAPAKPKKKKAAAVVVPIAEAPAAPESPEAPVAPEAPEAVTTPDSSHEIWKQVIQFEPESDALPPAVKTSLERIGKTLDVYPLQKVRIVGCAAPEESGASTMAKNRAAAVRSALVNDYHVDPQRIMIGKTRVAAGKGMSKVELSITN